MSLDLRNVGYRGLTLGHRIQTVSAFTSVAGYAGPSSPLQTTPEVPVLLPEVQSGASACVTGHPRSRGPGPGPSPGGSLHVTGLTGIFFAFLTSSGFVHFLHPRKQTGFGRDKIRCSKKEMQQPRIECFLLRPARSNQVELSWELGGDHKIHVFYYDQSRSSSFGNSRT